MYRSSKEILKVNLVYLIGLVLLLLVSFLPASILTMDSYLSLPYIFGCLSEILVAAVPALFLLITPAGKPAREKISFRYPGILTLLLTFLFAFPMFYAANSLANGWIGYIGLFGGKNLPPDTIPDPVTWLDYVLAIFFIGVLPGVCEEFTFRGVVLPAYRERYGSVGAIFISGLMFGCMHGAYYAAPVHIGMGWILGLLYVMTESLWPGILLHFTYNSLSLLVPLLMRGMEQPELPSEPMAYAATLITSGIMGVAFCAVPIVLLLFGIKRAAKKHLPASPLPMGQLGGVRFTQYLPLLFAFCICMFLYLNTLMYMFLPEELLGASSLLSMLIGG